MLLIINKELKISVLIMFFCAVGALSAKAADLEEKDLGLHAAGREPHVSSVPEEDPWADPKKYILSHQDEPCFGLLARIPQLRERDKNSADLADHLVAARYLNKACFLSPLKEGIKEKIIQALGDLLVFGPTNATERKIIFEGLAHEVLNLCLLENKDFAQMRSSDFWYDSFKERHQNWVRIEREKEDNVNMWRRSVVAALMVSSWDPNTLRHHKNLLFQNAWKKGIGLKDGEERNIYQVIETEVGKIIGLHLLRAAEGGDSDAQYKVGVIFNDKELSLYYGFSEHEARPEEWFRRAADQKHLAAMYELAELLAYQRDGLDEAIQWYTRSALWGRNVWSMGRLVAIFINKKRPAAEKYWHLEIAIMGDKYAMAECDWLYRGENYWEVDAEDQRATIERFKNFANKNMKWLVPIADLF